MNLFLSNKFNKIANADLFLESFQKQGINLWDWYYLLFCILQLFQIGSRIPIQLNFSVYMNYKHHLPPQSQRSKHLATVMANRRQLTRVLPKMLAVLLIELEDLKDAHEIVFAKSFLSAFEYFTQILSPEAILSKSLVEVLGFISDSYVRTKWNPNKRLPFETPAEILTWFCVFLKSHFSESELRWESKIGKEVIAQFKLMQIS